MKKKVMFINKLEVRSFVTNLTNDSAKKLNGGSSDPFGCCIPSRLC